MGERNGLTFREYLIGQAIAGLAGSEVGVPNAATRAIKLADEILEELAIERGEKERVRPIMKRPR